MTRGVPLWWTMAPSDASLDPARYLGRLSELPEPRLGGEWCDVTLHDEGGELNWRLIAVEQGRVDSLFAERRSDDEVRAGTDGTARREGRVTEPAAADR